MSGRFVFCSLFVSATTLIGGMAPGCAKPAAPSPARQTLSDRLRDQYPDLANGLFVTIADFEDPVHTELFHSEAAGDAEADWHWAVTGGVGETGGRCLSIRLRGAEARLVADDQAATDWHLVRDWRPYNLLLMAVHSSAPADLDLALVSGAGEYRAKAHSRVVLQSGWNQVRLDLNDAADFIALDDIRAVGWSVAGGAEAVELRLDDVVLADNRRNIFGSPDNGEGRLYVTQVGRRCCVGAAGRFELGFANGEIVHWYALAEDRARLTNRVGPAGALGPTVVVVPEDDPARRRSLAAELAASVAGGKLAVTRQRLVEASPVRAVIASELALGGEEDGPVWRTTYHVYATGQVYSRIECPAEAGDLPAQPTGLAVGCLAMLGLTVEAHEPSALEGAELLRHVPYGAFFANRDGAGLVWVVAGDHENLHLRQVRDGDRPRVSLVAWGEAAAGPSRTWASLLSVWPPGNAGSPTREIEAAAYTKRPTIEFLVGRLKVDQSGDEDGDGYAESSGTFGLELDGPRVHFRLDGRQRRMVSPAFCVAGTAGREAWVYVDQVIHRPVARDADGNVIFQLPGVVERAVAVEVYVRERAGETVP